jgi:hypothetical protein
MLTLRWAIDGRDCTADFAREEEARPCAEVIRTRDDVRGVMLLDEDVLPLESSVPAT